MKKIAFAFCLLSVLSGCSGLIQAGSVTCMDPQWPWCSAPSRSELEESLQTECLRLWKKEKNETETLDRSQGIVEKSESYTLYFLPRHYVYIKVGAGFEVGRYYQVETSPYLENRAYPLTTDGGGYFGRKAGDPIPCQ